MPRPASADGQCPLKPGVLDLQARSWAEYGPNVGAWRLLDILAARRRRFRVLYERHPRRAPTSPAARHSAAGHVVAAHGWGQEIIPAYQTRRPRSADLARCLAPIETATGAAPRAGSARAARPAPRTARCSPKPASSGTPISSTATCPRHPTADGRDRRHPLHHGGERHAALCALRQRARSLHPHPHPASSNWPRSPGRPACLDITVHAHVFGRPFGAIEFARSLALVQADPHAFLTDHDALARTFART